MKVEHIFLKLYFTCTFQKRKPCFWRLTTLDSSVIHMATYDQIVGKLHNRGKARGTRYAYRIVPLLISLYYIYIIIFYRYDKISNSLVHFMVIACYHQGKTFIGFGGGGVWTLNFLLWQETYALLYKKNQTLNFSSHYCN